MTDISYINKLQSFEIRNIGELHSSVLANFEK